MKLEVLEKEGIWSTDWLLSSLSLILNGISFQASLTNFSLKDGRIQKGTSNPEVVGHIRILNFGDLLFERLNRKIGSLKGEGLQSKDDIRRALTQEEIKESIMEVTEEILESQPGIVNSHVAYLQRGSIQINPDVEKRIGAQTYFFVWADPEKITHWRNSEKRAREEQSVKEILIHQEIALEATFIIASHLGAGFITLYNRNDSLSKNVAKLLTEAEQLVK